MTVAILILSVLSLGAAIVGVLQRHQALEFSAQQSLERDKHLQLVTTFHASEVKQLREENSRLLDRLTVFFPSEGFQTQASTRKPPDSEKFRVLIDDDGQEAVEIPKDA